MVLADSNVLIDWLTRDPTWYDWASEQIEQAIDGEGLAINPLILAEVSADFDHEDDVERALPIGRFQRLPLSYTAAFRAGKAFKRYKRQEKGKKRSPMPDFYIGAHAEVSDLKLLTRDVRRFRTYFPSVALLTPPGV